MLGEEDAADRVETLAKRVFGSRNRNGEPGGQHSQSYAEPREASTELAPFAETTTARRAAAARRGALEAPARLRRSSTLELALIAPMRNIALVDQ
jgi:hypothetical protein